MSLTSLGCDMNIAFLGFGTISRQIYEYFQKNSRQSISFYGYFDPYINIADHSLSRISSFEEILESPADMVIEAANQEAVKKYVPQLIRSGKNVISMSVGAYLDEYFYSEITSLCNNSDYGTLHIPSGALPAVDAIQAVSRTKITEVHIVTRKPYSALDVGENDTPGQAHGAVTVFEGSAKDAVAAFPKNINISATLSLISIGSTETRVRIIADPEVDKNIHKIYVKGDFGDLTVEIKSNPSSNPKTSVLAPLSVISLLEKMVSGIKFGS